MHGLRSKNVANGMRSMPEANQETPADQPPWRLLILSDIRFLREALADVLARDGTFTISGIAANLGEALVLARAVPPQVTLIDAALPDGLVAARNLGELGVRIQSWRSPWPKLKAT
jgi:hypothetical protein